MGTAPHEVRRCPFALSLWLGSGAESDGLCLCPAPPAPRGQAGGAEGLRGPLSGQQVRPSLPPPVLVAKPWATSGLGPHPLSCAPFITFFAIFHDGVFLLSPPLPLLLHLCPEESNTPEFGEYSSQTIHCSSRRSLSSCAPSVSEHQKGRSALWYFLEYFLVLILFLIFISKSMLLAASSWGHSMPWFEIWAFKSRSLGKLY